MKLDATAYRKTRVSDYALTYHTQRSKTRPLRRWSFCLRTPDYVLVWCCITDLETDATGRVNAALSELEVSATKRPAFNVHVQEPDHFWIFLENGDLEDVLSICAKLTEVPEKVRYSVTNTGILNGM